MSILFMPWIIAGEVFKQKMLNAQRVAAEDAINITKLIQFNVCNCQHCKSLHHKDFCPNCGAPRKDYSK